MKYDPVLLEADRYPFAMTVAPRFADLDLLVHINNLSLAEYHEEARVRFLLDLLGDDLFSRRRNFRMLVAKAAYDYLHEAHYPQPLEARVAVSRIGDASFELAMALFQEGRCVCLAAVVEVYVTDDGPVSIPGDMREKLRSRLLRRE